MKKVAALFLALVLMVCLSACFGGIKGDEAKAHIQGFLDAVEAADYEAAATFLHPERPADLRAFFEALKTQKSLDFSQIEIEKYTGVSSASYDSTVAGSAYSLTMDTLVSGEEVKMQIEIVRNDAGFGIYNFDIIP